LAKHASGEAAICGGVRAAVTGVFSYSGRFIAEALLARGWEVVALGRSRPSTGESLAGRVSFCPLLLDDEDALAGALSGCDALFNTYWVRFEYGGATFAQAVERSGRLRGFKTTVPPGNRVIPGRESQF
jgi:NAD(P)-dependent dehydrogenase (short-subunit alcohol dehydrogenase family)